MTEQARKRTVPHQWNCNMSRQATLIRWMRLSDIVEGRNEQPTQLTRKEMPIALRVASSVIRSGGGTHFVNAKIDLAYN
jgi:hypothetical protein